MVMFKLIKNSIYDPAIVEGHVTTPPPQKDEPQATALVKLVESSPSGCVCQGRGTEVKGQHSLTGTGVLHD